MGAAFQITTELFSSGAAMPATIALEWGESSGTHRSALIGLGVVLVYLDGRWLLTRDPIYGAAAKFWTRIFGSPEAPMAWTLNSVVGTVVAATVAAVFAGPQPEGEGH